MARVQDAVLAMLNHFPRPLGRTELLKLIYIADCEYFRLFGKTVTGLSYWRDQRGPVNYAVIDATRHLEAMGLISRMPYVTINGRKRISHSIRPAGRSVPVDCTAEELRVLAATAKLATGWSPDEIVAFAYDTPPMRRILDLEDSVGECALRGEAVPMEEMRRIKPRFKLEELQETLRNMDLTVQSMTAEAIQEYRELNEEFRPYRERAYLVTGQSDN